jgi:hypothetical protein
MMRRRLQMHCSPSLMVLGQLVSRVVAHYGATNFAGNDTLARPPVLIDIQGSPPVF